MVINYFTEMIYYPTSGCRTEDEKKKKKWAIISKP